MSEMYIRVPVPGSRNNGFTYVKVDTGRLSLEVVTQLWIKIHGREGNPYQPASNSAATLQESVDLTPLRDATAEVLANYQDTFDTAGEAGEIVKSEILPAFKFDNLFEHIANGRAEFAAYELREFLYAILSGVSELTERLARANATLSGMEVSYDQAVNSLDTGHAVTKQIYRRLVDAMHRLLEATKILTEIEVELEKQRQRVKAAVDSWRGRLSPEAEVVKDATSFIIGNADTTGFNMMAHAYMRNPEATNITEELEFAKLLLKDCLDERDDVRDSWQRLRTAIQSDVLPLRRTIDQGCADLAETSREIREFFSRVGENAPAPYTLPQFEGSISEEQYEAALQTARDSHWAPRVTRARLENLANNLLQGLEEPDFPEEVRSMLDSELARVRQVEEEKRIRIARQSREAAASTETQTLVRAQEAIPLPRSTTEADANEPSEARAREVYEMVVCVGAVLTNKPYHFASSTVRSMLDLLVRMGRLTEEEKAAVHASVLAMSHRSGERHIVPEGVKPNTRWKSRKETWIVTKRKSKTRLKITQHAARQCEQLFARHRLTVEEIERAKEARAKEKEEARKRYRKSKKDT